MIWEKLDPIQQRGVLHVESLAGSGLYFDQGTGKTWVTAGVIERASARIEDFTALGFVPLTNKESSWLKTLSLIDGLTVCFTLEELGASPTPRVLLLHPQKVLKNQRTGRSPLLEKLVKLHWDFVWVDEAQGLNTRSSNYSRALRRFRDQPWRCVLTGTPIDAAPEQSWGQMRFVDPTMFGTTELEYTLKDKRGVPLKDERGRTLSELRTVLIGEVWAAFELVFMEEVPWREGGFKNKKTGFAKKRFKKGMRERYMAIVAKYLMRVDQAEALPDLKPAIFHTIKYPLFGEQKRIYLEMEADSLAEVKPGEWASAQLKITQQIRLQQITGGWLASDDGELTKIGDARQRALRELLRKRLVPPFVVFARYTHEIDDIYNIVTKFYSRVEKLTGATGSGKNKAKVRAAFNERFQSGELDAAIVQTKTGGVGIDLFRAQHGVAYSVGHSFIDFDQLVKRLLRRGQTGQVEFFLLQAISTIDGDIYSAIRLKRDVSEMFFARIRKHQRGA